MSKYIQKIFLFACVVFTSISSCGQLENEDVAVQPTPTPEPTAGTGDHSAQPTPTPSPTPTPVPPLVPKVFIGSNSQRFISVYTAQGEFIKVYDLSWYFTSGGVTAMSFADATNLLVFFDPGTGERVVKINIETDEINTAWGVDASLSTVILNGMSIVDDNIYFQKSTNIERFTFNLANNLFSRINTGGWPVTSTGSCPITAITDFVRVTNLATNYFLQLSSGANARINTWNINTTPACPIAGNSYNYTSAFPAAATYAALSGIQMPDGKVYIRFSNTAGNPVLAKYDFNGVIISNGAAVSTNLSAFGALATVRQKLVKFDDTNILYANWDSDFIGKMNTNGTWSVFARDGYTIDAAAIAVRP